MKKYSFVIELLKPYTAQVFLNILFNFLTSLFSVFTFASIIPFLNILFKEMTEITPHPGDWQFSSDYIMALANHHVESFIVTEGKEQALLMICFFIVGIFFVKNAARFFAQYHMALIRNGVVRDVRQHIHSRILSLPLLYFNNEKKGNVVTKATSDVTEIEFSIMGSLQMIFREPVTFFIYFIVLLGMSWKLTIFIIVILPISGFIISKIAKSLKNAAGRGQTQLGEVMSLFEETLSGLRVIKAFNAEEKIDGKFKRESDDFFRLMVRLFRRQYLASPLSEIIGSIALTIVLFYGGKLILDGTSSFDGAFFVTFLIIFSQLIPPAKAFSEGFFKLKKGLASTERIEELFKEEAEPIHKGKNLKVKTFKDKIEFRNLSYQYPNGAYALKNINLTVNKGESVALVGQSGSGKTTLVNLLPLFLQAEKGQIFIDGTDILDFNLQDLRALFGVVSQEAVLFNDTVRNNIALGKTKVKDESIVKSAQVANAWEFIEKLEGQLDYNIGENGSNLSGGQKQRLSIARAVLTDAPILLLDEATSALDTESEKLVQEALNKLMQDRTSLVIAHRLSTIVGADKIVVLNDGEILETGTHDELIAQKGKYWNLSNLQGLA